MVFPAIDDLEALVAVRDVPTYRRVLHNGDCGSVEDLSVSSSALSPTGHSSHHQLAIPYAGAFTWTVARSTALLDSNRILYVAAGQDYAETHPSARVGHASVVINPTASLLAELCRNDEPNRHSAYCDITRPTTSKVRLFAHRWLHEAATAEALELDELLISTLREALSVRTRTTPAPTRLVNRAKDVLHARGDANITLDEISAEVGCSPIYLTQAFSRSEGLPLYRYHRQLRLSRALNELPHRDCITGLALDLGFSSHSHFSAAFKSSFGVTPSAFRNKIRGHSQRERVRV